MSTSRFVDVVEQARHRAHDEEEVDALTKLEEDLKVAWSLLSPDSDSLSWTQLQESLHLLRPDMQLQEAKVLCGPTAVTYDRLRHLLCKTRRPDGWDAESEAFKQLGVHGTDPYLDISILCELLNRMPGVGGLSADDMKLLKELTDFDGDGHISLEDFRAIGSFAPEAQPERTGELLKQLTATRQQRSALAASRRQKSGIMSRSRAPSMRESRSQGRL